MMLHYAGMNRVIALGAEQGDDEDVGDGYDDNKMAKGLRADVRLRTVLCGGWGWGWRGGVSFSF